MLWEANIVRKKSNNFICEGEWTQFVVHHQLKPGDILLFFLIDKSTFQVMAYNQKCYSNFSGNQQFEELSSSSDEKQDVGRKSIRVQTEPIESSGNAVALFYAFGVFNSCFQLIYRCMIMDTA